MLQLSPISAPYEGAGQRARDASTAGDHRAAVVNFEMALAYQPWSADDLALLAQEQLALGDTDSARDTLERLASIKPLGSDETLLLISLNLQTGQQDRAAQIALDAANRGQLDESSLADAVEQAFKSRSWWLASAALQAQLSLNPDQPSLQTRLALVQALVQPSSALVSAERAVVQDATHAGQLGDLIAVLSSPQAATRDTAHWARLGAIYIDFTEYDLADDALTRATSLNPAYGEALAYLAYVRAKLGLPSLGIVQQAVALEPASPPTRFLAGLTWKTLGRHSEARAEFERAFTLDPTNPAIAVEVANTHRAQSASPYAEIWLLEAARLSGGDLHFRLLLAQFYVDDNYRVIDAGLPLAQQLVVEAPDSAEAHDALGWAYFLIGALDRASEQLSRAVALDPTLARAYLHRAALLEAQGNPGAAISDYQRTIELDPSGVFGSFAARALARLTEPVP